MHSRVWNQEPDDIKHAENCVALNYMGGSSDEMCSRSLGYICEAIAGIYLGIAHLLHITHNRGRELSLSEGQ